MDKILYTLNDRQIDAVTSERTNMLIFAGAGSGKTRVLVSRIVYLMKVESIPPSAIMAVTFTNKAATELRSRIQAAVGGNEVRDMWVGTFHGLCNRFLRMHSERAGLPRSFSIIDETDRLNAVKRILKENPDLALATRKPADYVSYISACKERGIRASKARNNVAPNDPEAKAYSGVYSIYEGLCEVAGSVDFDELILRTCETLRNDAALRASTHASFREILIDEFQDTNDMQMELVRLLKGSECMVTVVGDDDQSIYSWRGANPENILSFDKSFGRVKTVRLEQNYRSSGNIIGAASSLISKNSVRADKKLWTEADPGEKVHFFQCSDSDDEAEFVAKRICELHKKRESYSGCSVLYRNNSLSLQIETALRQADIPFKIMGGLSFFERAEIKDALAYARLLVNENDSFAFDRIINVPNRGIGPKSKDALYEIAFKERVSLPKAGRLAVQRALLEGKAAAGLAKFLSCMDMMAENISGLELGQAMECIVTDSGLLEYYEEEDKKERDIGRGRTANLSELVNSAAAFSPQDEIVRTGPEALLAYLEEQSLNADLIKEDDDPDADKVRLMTAHSAKGLEFDNVFLIGFDQGTLPSGRSIELALKGKMHALEEERRLAYVAVTRAKKRCYLTSTRRRRVFGKYTECERSQFLNEMDPCFLDEILPEGSFAAFRRMSSGNGSGWSSPRMPGKSALAVSDAKPADLKEGDIVEYGTLGIGKIVKIMGEGKAQRAWIDLGSRTVQVMTMFTQVKKINGNED